MTHSFLLALGLLALTMAAAALTASQQQDRPRLWKLLEWLIFVEILAMIFSAFGMVVVYGVHP